MSQIRLCYRLESKILNVVIIFKSWVGRYWIQRIARLMVRLWRLGALYGTYRKMVSVIFILTGRSWMFRPTGMEKCLFSLCVVYCSDPGRFIGKGFCW